MVTIDWEFEAPTIFKAICKEKTKNKENQENKENKENQENKEINVNEIHYQFEIVRIKDVSTKREYLDIKMKVDGNDNGTISVEPSNIAQGLLSLREYGIMFSDDNSRIKLARCIEQKYQQIAVSVQTESNNKIANARFGVFLGAIGEYVRAAEDQRKSGLSYVLVADFDAIALDCGYQPFEINGLRNLLKDKGYIHTTDKRNTLIIRLRGKVTRVIGFKDEKMVAEKYYDKLDDKTADSKKAAQGE